MGGAGVGCRVGCDKRQCPTSSTLFTSPCMQAVACGFKALCENACICAHRSSQGSDGCLKGEPPSGDDPTRPGRTDAGGRLPQADGHYKRHRKGVRHGLAHVHCERAPMASRPNSTPVRHPTTPARMPRMPHTRPPPACRVRDMEAAGWLRHAPSSSANNT